MRQTFLWRPLLAAVLCLGAPAAIAAAGPMDFLFTSGVPPREGGATPRTWKLNEFSALRLAPREAGAAPNAHPAAWPAESVRAALAAVRWRPADARERALFDTDELDRLAAGIARALAAATPADDLLVLASARRDNLLVAPPSSIAARAWVDATGLNLIVTSARDDLVSPYRVSRLVPVIDFGSRERAGTLVLGGAPAVAGRTDWLRWAAPTTVTPTVAAPPAAVAPVTPALAPPVAAPAPAARAASATAPAPAAPRRDPAFYEEQARRLQGLQKLREQGLLSEDEYQRKRREILDTL